MYESRECEDAGGGACERGRAGAERRHSLEGVRRTVMCDSDRSRANAITDITLPPLTSAVKTHQDDTS